MLTEGQKQINSMLVELTAVQRIMTPKDKVDKQEIIQQIHTNTVKKKKTAGLKNQPNRIPVKNQHI